MNVRTDLRTTSKRLILALAVLCLLWIAWRILTLGMAQYLSRSDPAAALAWRSGHAEALLQELDLESAQHRYSAVQRQNARAAIHAAPLDGRGYRMLANQAELRGDLPMAMSVYSIAARRGPRELPTLGRLIQYQLKQGNRAQALAYIDQVLRVEPETAPQMFPVVASILSQDPGDVAKLLLQQPPWRSAFLVQLVRHAQESPALPRLFDLLRRSPGGLSPLELSAWLDRLIKNDQWGPAYLSWVESLSPDASKRIGNVYNGGFELEPSQLGFDWRFSRVPGARISLSQVTGAGGQFALRVDFEDRRIPFRHVRQLLALVPGTYQIRGRVRTDDLRGERGLVWTLTCAEDGRVIGETDPVTGRHVWQSFERDFAVPVEKCGGQWLTLRVPARIPAEQRLGGTAWFDDLSIQATYP
jgi:tetratricopeptide (TPR) repeat protein